MQNRGLGSDPFKRCSSQAGKVKLPGNNFVTPFFLLAVKLDNFVTPFLLLSVKITYCLEGKMVTLRALNKLDMQKCLKF